MGAGNKLGFSGSTAIVHFHGTVSLALNLALLNFHALSFLSWIHASLGRTSRRDATQNYSIVFDG